MNYESFIKFGINEIESVLSKIPDIFYTIPENTSQ